LKKAILTSEEGLGEVTVIKAVKPTRARFKAAKDIDSEVRKRRNGQKANTGSRAKGSRQSLTPEINVVRPSKRAATQPGGVKSASESRHGRGKLESSASITDQLLLDTVRDQVYEKLAAGEIELDIGDGFKAIEIKHKIAEESQNEKLLLEILNEIRSEELARKSDHG